MSNQRNNDQPTPAETLLDELAIRSAPIPVDRIAKSLGAVVRFSPLDEELSGMIYIKENIIIIGVNSLHHPNRQRFTIAHEIGHLKLHRNLITTAVHVDKDFLVPVLMRGATASLGTQKIEIEANAFAADLLMPRFLLDQSLSGKIFDIDDDKPLEELAKKFRVSKKMVEYRIANLS
jgi:Zn-dependent peptidase ImmA (M78 family)